MKTTALYRKSLKSWGWQAQAIKLLEEMGELQQATAKHLLKQGGVSNLAEEMADVVIMVEQLRFALKLQKKCARWREMKLKRLEKRLK